jgi:hypothetical protein
MIIWLDQYKSNMSSGVGPRTRVLRIRLHILVEFFRGYQRMLFDHLHADGLCLKLSLPCVEENKPSEPVWLEHRQEKY